MVDAVAISKKQKHPKRWPIVIIGILIAVCLAAGGYFAYSKYQEHIAAQEQGKRDEAKTFVDERRLPQGDRDLMIQYVYDYQQEGIETAQQNYVNSINDRLAGITDEKQKREEEIMLYIDLFFAATGVEEYDHAVPSLRHAVDMQEQYKLGTPEYLLLANAYGKTGNKAEELVYLKRALNLYTAEEEAYDQIVQRIKELEK